MQLRGMRNNESLKKKEKKKKLEREYMEKNLRA